MKALCRVNLSVPLGENSPHGMVVGPTGSGKTQKFMLPLKFAALSMGAGTVIINTKGKKFTRVCERLTKKTGRKARVLAFRDPARSVAWNPLDGVKTLGDAREVAFVIANSAEALRVDNHDSPFFFQKSVEWLASAILALATKHPPEEQTLAYLRQIIVAGLFEPFAKMHPEFPALAAHARYQAAGGQNAETVSADIGFRTNLFDDERLQAVTSTNELRIDEFIRDGGVLIIEIDEHDIKELAPLSALFLTRLFNAMLRVAAQSPTGKLPHRFFVFINEFAAHGRIPGIEVLLHTLRERRCSVIADAQAIGQFATYGPQASVVLAGFNTQVALPGLDLDSAGYFAARSGTMTVKTTTINQDYDDATDAVRDVGRNYSLGARHVLLSSEISRPPRHPILGMPATFFLGGGVPPFQAYLTPAYEIGWFAKLMEDAEGDDDDTRAVPLVYVPRQLPSTDAATKTTASQISDTKGWSEAKLRRRLEAVKKEFLSWDETTGSAHKWWEAFERENEETKLAMILRLAEELASRKPPATITEFFLAYVYSNTDNIQANLCYLDYTRLKKEEERRKREARPKPPTAPEANS